MTKYLTDVSCLRIKGSQKFIWSSFVSKRYFTKTIYHLLSSVATDDICKSKNENGLKLESSETVSSKHPQKLI